MKQETTSDLFRMLFKSPDLSAFLQCTDIVSFPTFCEHIKQLCLEKNEKIEHVIKRAGIERTYGYQLFNGTRNPSRDKVIQIALGLGLDVDETQKLLQVAKKSPLYVKIKRDAAIIYCIVHKMDFAKTQDMLMKIDESILSQ